MAEGGGTTLLSPDDNVNGPGGQSYDEGCLAVHDDDGAADGGPMPAVRQRAWRDDGWPVVRTADQVRTS